jgi:hypothetical protein
VEKPVELATQILKMIKNGMNEKLERPWTVEKKNGTTK